MAINHMQDAKSIEAQKKYARRLGIHNYQFGAINGSPAIAAGVYGKENRKNLVPDTSLRRRRAFAAFRNPTNELAMFLGNYKEIVEGIEEDKGELNVQEREECLSCHEKYVGAYKVCGLCLHVYNQNFID